MAHQCGYYSYNMSHKYYMLNNINITFFLFILGYNDYMASKDNLRAISAFFEKFPERAGNGFYLASESYGGHYIPQWTLQVLNDPTARVHFKGYLLGRWVLLRCMFYFNTHLKTRILCNLFIFCHSTPNLSLIFF